MIQTICIMTALIMISSFVVGHLIKLTIEAILIRIISIQEMLKDQGEFIAIRKCLPDGTTEINLTIPKARKHEYDIIPISHCNPAPCSEKACVDIEEGYYDKTTMDHKDFLSGLDKIDDKLKEIKQNIIKEKQIPSKLRVMDNHLAILDKVSQSEGAFETSFKHDVNELFIKRKEWGVALEFEKDKPICYTIRKGDSTRDVIYLDQVERWLGVDKKNKDRINNSIKSPKYYDDKVKQYIEIKRNTLKGDVAVLKEIGLSAKALKMYEEPYKEEINKLRDACRQKHIETLKAKYPPKAPKGGK